MNRYKSIDINNQGHLEISGKLTTNEATDKYYQVHPIDNLSQKIDIYQKNQLIEYKILTYDHNYKIISNALFRNDQLVDTRQYTYDPQSGNRTKKTIVDNQGQIVTETSY